MDVREAQAIIKMNLKGECIADVVEVVDIAFSTAYRWREKIVEHPDLITFIKLCAYYDIDVSIYELRSFYSES